MLHRPGPPCGLSIFCSLRFQLYCNGKHLLVCRLTTVVNQYNSSDVNQVMLDCLVAVAGNVWKNSL